MRAQELGAVGYVVKPFDPLELAGTVRDVLERVARGEREQLNREFVGARVIADAAPPGLARAGLRPPRMGSLAARLWPLRSARRRSSPCSPSRAFAPSFPACSTSSRSSSPPPSAGASGGLVAVAASAFPFFHYFASRYDRNQVNAEGATALAVFIVAALFGQRGARTRADGARAGRAAPCSESELALDAATRLQGVADALATAHTPQEVLDAVLTEGVRAAEARGGLIATLSEDGDGSR